LKYIAPKGNLEWDIVLDTLGFAVENGRICDATGQSAKCKECSAPVTMDNMGALFRGEDGKGVFVCHACHLFVLLEMLGDDEEIDGVEFDYTNPDEFFAGFNKMYEKKGVPK